MYEKINLFLYMKLTKNFGKVCEPTKPMEPTNEKDYLPFPYGIKLLYLELNTCNMIEKIIKLIVTRLFILSY